MKEAKNGRLYRDKAYKILDADCAVNLGLYELKEPESCRKTLTPIHLSARLVFHRKGERIIAHFPICHTVLLIYRLLEAKPDKYGTLSRISTIISRKN